MISEEIIEADLIQELDPKRGRRGSSKTKSEVLPRQSQKPTPEGCWSQHGTGTEKRAPTAEGMMPIGGISFKVIGLAFN